MTVVYIDTSAFLAVLDADDRYYPQALKIWKRLLRSGTQLICSSYVLTEVCALIQNRLGMEAVRVFHEAVYPILHVHWVDATLHETGMNAVLVVRRKRLSLVDCVSFAIMRKLGIKESFTFDKHFGEQGFTVITPD
jgi:predicted nucleic acid-binding protein